MVVVNFESVLLYFYVRGGVVLMLLMYGKIDLLVWYW